MDSPYYVILHRAPADGKFEYKLQRSDNDTIVLSDDIVLLHRIADLLNDEENNKEGR